MTLYLKNQRISKMERIKIIIYYKKLYDYMLHIYPYLNIKKKKKKFDSNNFFTHELIKKDNSLIN
jgi:hypothetical protein